MGGISGRGLQGEGGHGGGAGEGGGGWNMVGGAGRGAAPVNLERGVRSWGLICGVQGLRVGFRVNSNNTTTTTNNNNNNNNNNEQTCTPAACLLVEKNFSAVKTFLSSD